MKKTRIGILGGTFNPVHNGHLKAAAIVQKRFSLDRVLFIPSFIPPHKTTAGVAPASDRLAMVKLAVRGRPRFIASAVETEAGGKSYSILTLNKIKKRYPGAWIFFILGVDAFLEIKTWREWKRVLGQCLFIVVTRPGYRLREVVNAVGGEYRSRFRFVPPAERVRERWFSEPRIFLLPIEAADISSTEVRQRARERRSLKGWVPGSVEGYIQMRSLYRRKSSSRNTPPASPAQTGRDDVRGQGGKSKSRRTWTRREARR